MKKRSSSPGNGRDNILNRITEETEEKFPNLRKDICTHIQRAHRTSTKYDYKGNSPWCNAVKTLFM